MESKNKQFRNFLITLNNPKVAAKDWIKRVFDELKAVYACGQLEKGENGTPHIQAFFNLKNAKKMDQLKRIDASMHIEGVNINNGAHTYCMKEETRVEGPWEFGVRPVQRNSKEDWDNVWELAKQGKLEEIPAEIRVKHYHNLTKIAKDSIKVIDKDHLRGVWVHGKPGTGKSRWAREQHEEFYPKLCNKWWDGYRGQPLVIMDDVEPTHKVLSQQLKIWADRYGCILETKGAAMSDNYQWFVVTSNWTIDEMEFGDSRITEAIKRRFKEISIEEITLTNFKLKFN